MTKLWGGRFEEEPAAELLAFTESLSFDRALVRDDCAVLLAHTRALARAGLLSDDDAEAVASALGEVANAIASGEFAFVDSDEDVHTAVERALLDRLPEAGARVRAGLSRNDRVATALRLWLMREGGRMVAGVAGLIETLADRADDHREVVMPGYTHLQRAQPVTLSHHLLAHAAALVRDAGRLRDALVRADTSPLGAGALAGSTLGLNHETSARELGFSAAMPNSIDAVSARDFVAEFVSAGAILAVHLSRIGEELVLWTTDEFGFARLADAYATGSSLMPQKKNPDVAELTRGKAGRIIGNLTGLLATLKGLPLAYNRDLQEDKEPLFDTVRALRGMLAALTGAMRTLTFDPDAMERAAGHAALVMTDLAEYLAGKGVPFRDAHEIVGAIVREGGRLTPDGLRAFSDRFEPDVAAVLDVRGSVERRGAPGPSSASVDAQLKAVRAAVEDIRSA